MLIVGIEGTTLTDIERSRLLHPSIAGVILFTRNIADREQSQALIDEIRSLREAPLLVCVDQEGGPVQRFREGYASLPPLVRLGALYDRDPERAVALTREHAWLMASEMRAIGIDFSYAPVLDLARGNRAIGDRAFHADPAVCAVLGAAYIESMKAAGMRTTGKHFPGHGSVLEDTHYSEAIDRRRWPELASADLVPFQAAIEAGVDAMMMGHVTYPAIDPLPAGYSEHWIRHVLRDSMGFDGIVVSDDIAMAAAEGAGAVGRRVQLHLEAGCDVVLVCKPALVEEAIDAVPWDHLDNAQERLAGLAGQGALAWTALAGDPRRAEAVSALSALA